LKLSQVERALAHARSAQIKAALVDLGLPLLPSVSHIIPVLVGDAARCKAACDLLLSRHRLYLQPINYPTVPKGTERLRITASPCHTTADVEALVRAMDDVWTELRLPRRDREGSGTSSKSSTSGAGLAWEHLMQPSKVPTYAVGGPHLPAQLLDLLFAGGSSGEGGGGASGGVDVLDLLGKVIRGEHAHAVSSAREAFEPVWADAEKHYAQRQYVNLRRSLSTAGVLEGHALEEEEVSQGRIAARKEAGVLA